jgi:hypothetical protein
MNLHDCSLCLWNLGHHLGWGFDPLIICIFWFMLFVWIWIFPLDICWVLTKHPICTPFYAKAHRWTLAGQCIYWHNYVIVIQWKFNDPWCSHLEVLCSSFIEYHCGMFHVSWLLTFLLLTFYKYATSWCFWNLLRLSSNGSNQFSNLFSLQPKIHFILDSFIWYYIERSFIKNLLK